MSNNPSPALAALLSFIFPGLGQLYAGDARKAVLWALPMLIFILAVMWVVFGGIGAMASLFSSPEKRIALLVLNGAFFLYHVAAMLDAYSQAKQERYSSFSSSSAAPIALAVLVALTMILHGVPQVWGMDINNSFSNIFDNDDNDDVLPSFQPLPSLTPSPIPSGDVPTDGPSATPSPTGSGTPGPTDSGGPDASETPRACAPIDLGAWQPAEDGRVNILLVGSDSRSDDGVSSASIRTDSMLLLSVDVATCKAAMFSFPRNMEQPTSETSRYPDWLRIPTERAGDYQGYLFGLWQKAATTPADFEGSVGIGPECAQQFDCERGWRALTYAIQTMSGVKVDGIMSVNLKGFVDVVNNLPEGGLWIDVPSPLFDDAYYDSNQQKMLVDFEAGCQFMNGEEVLAYARSRHQDSDYQRSRRQQYVLTQVRKQLDPIALVPHIPALLGVAEANLFMTIDDSDIPFLAQVLGRIDADRIYRYDFAPAKVSRLESPQGMQAKVQNIFDEPEPAPTTRPDQEKCPPN